MSITKTREYRPRRGIGSAPVVQWVSRWLRAAVALGILALLGCQGVAESPDGSDNAAAIIRFDTGAWHTAPPDLLDNPDHPDAPIPEDWLWARKSEGHPGESWRVQARDVTDLDGGLTIVSAPAGGTGRVGRWCDHHRFPTLATHQVPFIDWRHIGRIELRVFSDEATGELVTLALLSDSAETPWKDYLVQDVRIDWTGWQRIALEPADFRSCGQPAGWQAVSGVCFFTKIQRRNPNPYTSLLLESLRLYRAEGPIPASQPTPADDEFCYRIRHDEPSQPLNHTYPETTLTQGVRGYAQQHYFQGARAIFGYFPRYSPGYPSFSADGRAAINAGNVIQWLDDDGDWQTSDIRTVLIDWAEAQGWEGVFNAWGMQGADPMVRFDQDGDAYVLQQVEELDTAGKRVNWKTRTALLLHSRDNLKTWTVYSLPNPDGRGGLTATFEKLDGHNHEAQTRPPVILLGDYKYFGPSDQAGYLLLPEKRPDGSLNIPEPVRYAENCLSINYHSGDANVAVTHGGKIYIVFGWMPPQYLKGSRKSEALKVRGIHQRYGFETYMEFVKAYNANPDDYPDVDLADPDSYAWSHEVARETFGMPPIPEDHPALRMRYKTKTHWTWYSFARNGVPTYVRVYDIASGELSDPVYVGSGGGALDGHNWPGITVDSRGHLHVLINGHHNPPLYTRSLRPGDITEWTEPEYVMADPTGREGVDGQAALSYATLTCDQEDTLHCVHRGTSFRYDNSLVYYRKPAGAPWSAERTLVKNWKYMYDVWAQRMSYDRESDRLYLTFYSHASQAWMTWDSFRYYAFIWPDAEKRLYAFPKGEDGGPATPAKGWGGKTYRPGAAELTILVSDDHGDTWRPAVTVDFSRNGESR